MSRLKRFMISRKTVITLIVLILIAVIAGYIFPQRFLTAPEKIEKWVQAHPYLSPISDLLGLDHIYTTFWFAIIVLFFSLSLSISVYDQLKIAWRQTFGMGGAPIGRTVELSDEKDSEIVQLLRDKGYFQLGKSNDERRFIKHPWGYWGKFLLHLGMAVVIAASLVILLTQKRGSLYLYEGETYIPGGEWTIEEKGLLAGSFVLPMTIRLVSVVPEFWQTDDLKHLTSIIEFTFPGGKSDKYELAVNRTLFYNGIKIYQSMDFGEAFFVEFINEKGERNGTILQISKPPDRARAGYHDFRFGWMQYVLKTKYFADAEKKSMDSSNPLLVMRLASGRNVISEVHLKKGETGRLGPYTVRLEDVKKWSGIIFVDITGMPGIFSGFFLVIMGSGLAYFTPPREVILRRSNEKTFLVRKSTRFEEFYIDEFDKFNTTG